MPPLESRWNSMLSAYVAYARITCGLHPSADDVGLGLTDRGGDRSTPSRSTEPLLQEDGGIAGPETVDVGSIDMGSR